MSIVWKYKIDVEDKEIFPKIEKEYGVVLPIELKEFILENNAATPSKYNFMLGNTEKVIGAVLSFNYGELDTDTVFVAFSTIEDRTLIPFAIDPFGNYICYSNNSKVVFWDHETSNVISTEKSLSEFLESLY